MIAETLPALSGAIQGDIVKPLAVSSPQRLAQFPDLPTMAETIPGFVARGWFALLAPTGTPDEIVQKVSSDLHTVLSQSELQQKFATLGTFVHPMSPTELATFVRSEQQMWKPIVQQAGLGQQ